MLRKIEDRIGSFLLYLFEKHLWVIYGIFVAGCALISLVCNSIPYIVAGCVLGLGECKLP